MSRADARTASDGRVPRPRRDAGGDENEGGGEMTLSGTDGGAPEAPTSSLGAEPGPVTPPQRTPWTGWDRVLRVAGVLIAIVAAVVSGVFELLLSTLRAGDVVSIWRGDAIGSGGGPVIGLSIVLAAVLNYGIAWFAVTTTGRKWAIGPPWALWTLFMLFAAGVRTPEGDYLLTGDNWVALVMILVGSLTYAVYSYRMILKRVPR
jgi:hypothetical protein